MKENTRKRKRTQLLEVFILIAYIFLSIDGKPISRLEKRRRLYKKICFFSQNHPDFKIRRDKEIEIDINMLKETNVLSWTTNILS